MPFDSWLRAVLVVGCALSFGSAVPAYGGEFLGGLVRFETDPPPDAAPATTALPGQFGFGDQAWATDAQTHWQPSLPQPRIASWFHHSDPDDEHRHVGRGGPLYGTSWLNRPYHVGWFVGGLIGDAPINGQIDQQSDVYGGYRAGWDWDHYWGGELRLGFARPDLLDDQTADDPRIARNWFTDLNVLYYPWGDAGWRPYFSAGLGTASFRFRDGDGTQYAETLLHAPVGVGVKYLVDQWMVVRFDATDNLAVSGSGLDTMHNYSFTIGLEARFK